MEYSFEQTGIWQRSLGFREDDPNQHSRARLRNALLVMRSNAAQLVQFIPKDCKGLTVHDITHLDALWEIADIIVGDSFELNPVEAFVFGAAVLIHDAGMSAASYSGGMAEIIKTTEWRDIAVSVFRRANTRQISSSLIENPPEEFRQEILFSVLRTLHAKHAEEIVSIIWKLPDNRGEARLLEDQELRSAFGQSIGRIAHGHHWDIERVATQLRGRTGSALDFPATWTLHEIKIACLLRCADAAHIDHRRAPSMLYALTNPKGISKEHWNFQNKLKKPTRSTDRLFYSGASDFHVSEAGSWWLCYDAIKMIDNELLSCHALLQDMSEQPFAARRVFGAESPRILAQQIGCAGWLPVDAEIRVSDPGHLARTLGGRNLYGNDFVAPIRELLQNAADAIRARRTYENRDALWGNIRLAIEKKENETWLHIDDNGIGMSQRVLVGPLLDFGKSMWNSPLLREEFPGLEAQGIYLIGKFGIGFFSIFGLGAQVKVTSKRFDAGAPDIRVLEFSSIGSRPIIRPARAGELPTDFSTRVSVKLDRPEMLTALDEDQEPWRPLSRHRKPRNFPQTIQYLITPLDIKCEIVDEKGEMYIHHPDWINSDRKEFLEIMVLGTALPEVASAAHEKQLDKIVDNSGTTYGRAAIWMLEDSQYMCASVGGFVTPLSSFRFPQIPVIGIVKGETLDPGFARWIGPAGPKTAETLAKVPVPSFTRRVRQNSAT